VGRDCALLGPLRRGPALVVEVDDGPFRSRLLGSRDDVIHQMPAGLLLKPEPNFLALGEPVELARVCGKNLEIPLLHDESASGAIHYADLANHFLWRYGQASAPRPRGGGGGTGSGKEKYNQRDLHAHVGILQFV
jgi:hypothetical protein